MFGRETYAPIDVPAFLTTLRHQGCALGEPFNYFIETTSTNDEAKQAAARGATHGSVFLAECQSAGRGRRGKVWHAEPYRHLLASVLLRPNRPGANPSALTLVMGAALHEALQSLLPKRVARGLGIKWPNDLEHNARKLAGILVEGQMGADGHFVAVVGFGINVAPLKLPSAERGMPVSLRELGVQLSRESILCELLMMLDRRLNDFGRFGLAPFVDYINKYNALRDVDVRIEGIQGRVVAIGAGGQLILQTDQGLRNMTAGTVERT